MELLYFIMISFNNNVIELNRGNKYYILLYLKFFEFLYSWYEKI